MQNIKLTKIATNDKQLVVATIAHFDNITGTGVDEREATINVRKAFDRYLTNQIKRIKA
jgi:hypothetical protein